MIPKKLHYCWFSEDAYPSDIEQCMESWKRHLADFEIILWDKSRAEKIGIPWIDEALKQKKWAFAADAVRLYALKTEGGVYLDSDVEVLKNFDSLMERKNFFGFENGSKRIEGAVLGAEKNDPAISAALEFYTNKNFIYNESSVSEMVLPKVLENAFRNLPDSVEIFPESYFSPKSFTDGKIRITAETFCIHHFKSNWRPESVRKGIERRQWLYKVLPRPLAKALALPLSLWTNLQSLGVAGTLRKLAKR